MIIKVTPKIRFNVEGKNITIEKLAIVKEGGRTKSENIGKERWDVVGYYGRLDHAIYALINKHFKMGLENKEYELNQFADKLDQFMAQVLKSIKEDGTLANTGKEEPTGNRENKEKTGNTTKTNTGLKNRKLLKRMRNNKK